MFDIFEQISGVKFSASNGNDSGVNLQKLTDAIEAIGVRPFDVLITGATGAGKSSTINSYFLNEVARVGRGADPETMEITDFSINENLRLWDSPGLGDSVSKDVEHGKKIIELLNRLYNEPLKYCLIDFAVVIVDSGGRDMGTSFHLINEILLPHLGADRVLVALNQADMAMSGRGWDKNKNAPDIQLLEFLNQKTSSVQKRVLDTTGLKIPKPVFYSAAKGYNIDGFFNFIIDNLPKTRRVLKKI